ncbi:transmembrane protein 177-like [Lytechinus variegatus]|uniref:transmembrane protein 177-like n=1 Tax=Lytechinus variegatus TaxID=7654 RepID=UPI001BB2CF5A|nr:transmembrane protein 177-like [Lytechinus variegatus]
MSKFANFLRKPRNFAAVAVASAGVAFTFKAAPHLFPNHIYRPLFEAYKTGKPYKVTPEQQQEFQQACDDLNVDSSKFSTFVTSRWEVKSVGLPWFPAGCQTGIPASMVAEPELNNLRFSGPLKANLDSREGMWLKDSLKLSPAARRFAMARQIALNDSNLAFYPIVLAPITTLTGFATTFVVHAVAPVAPIFVTGLGIGTCFYFAYSFVMGSVNERIDLKVNQRLAAISDEYKMGGLEFYEKLLQKNRALRSLLGKRGEQLYTYYGNETPGLVYSTGATNIQKRDVLKEMVEAAEKERRAKEMVESAS